MKRNYVRPRVGERGYKDFKTKVDYLINHLLTTTIGTNTISFINAKTMDGLEMYKNLLDVFQGLEHEEDNAVNVAGKFEKLKFNRHSRYSPE